MIVDGHVRVSRVDERDNDLERFISPRVQRDQIERWAELRGVLVGKVFEELDESGGRHDRPLLQEAISRVECGDADGVVVAYMSRFGRSNLHGLIAIERITNAGGILAAVQEGIDFSTDIGRHMLRSMLSWAEWELDRTRSIWRVARQRAVARGGLRAQAAARLSTRARRETGDRCGRGASRERAVSPPGRGGPPSRPAAAT